MNASDSKLWFTEKQRECVFSNRYITVYKTIFEAPDKAALGPYFSLKLSNYAVIVAVDEAGDFICVRQFRHGLRQITTEFPAGGIVVDNKEEPITLDNALENAKRELLEETGYASEHWSHLFTVPANSTLADNYAWIFLATDCRKVSEQNLDTTEYLEVKKISSEELEAMIRAGEFHHAVHILAWYMTKEHLNGTETDK